jgi:hypothetical protein
MMKRSSNVLSMIGRSIYGQGRNAEMQYISEKMNFLRQNASSETGMGFHSRQHENNQPKAK